MELTKRTKIVLLALTMVIASVGYTAYQTQGRVPDYEVQTYFNRGVIQPYHTEYWIATSAGGTIAANEIQGWHALIGDSTVGSDVLILHSDRQYQVGFGDHVWGYGPPSAHQPTGEDISDRVYGQPPYYFGYVFGGPPTMDGRPFVPAYYKFEVTLSLKPVQQNLPFAVDQWTFFGKSEVDDYGNSMGILLYQNMSGLYYNWGNFPNQPYFKKVADGYYANTDTYMLIDVLYDYSYGDHTLGTATISWGSLKATVESVRERVGYRDTWPFFFNTEVTITQPGELLVRNVDIKFWGKVPGGPAQPTAWVSGQTTW